MEFTTTDKQIKMWCLTYVYDCWFYDKKIEGEDNVNKAERVYDFIVNYETSGAQKTPRASLFSRWKNFLRLKGRG